MARVFLAVVLLAFGIPSPVVAVAQEESRYRMFLNAGVGRFSGDYELPETTTMDVLNLSLRWYLQRGEIEISVPYLRIDGPADIRFVGGQPVAVPGQPPMDGELIAEGQRTDSGLGDAVLQGEYYLITGTSSRPWVIGLLRVKVPTGDEDRGLGTGAADVEAGFGLIQQFGSLHWLADASYTWVGSSDQFELRDVVRLGGGVSAPFGPDNRHSAYLYLENRTHMVRGSDDRRSLAMGVGTSLDQARRLRFSASAFVGLSDTAEDYGLYLTIGRRY
jgi:hypothetical protein